MVNEIIGQILSIIAMLLFCLSYQLNTKTKLLIVQTAGAACNCIGYLLIGASSGFALNIICMLRNVIYYFIKENSKTSLVSSLLLVMAMGVQCAFFWEGWISLLITVPLMVNTVFMSFGNPQLLRKSVIGTSSVILIYNCINFFSGGIISEALSVISSIVGIVRFKKSAAPVNSEPPHID